MKFSLRRISFVNSKHRNKYKDSGNSIKSAKLSKTFKTGLFLLLFALGCSNSPCVLSNLYKERGKKSDTHQMLFRMKKSWIKIQPKGKIPPMMIPGNGFVKNDCSGIWRGIWFVRTGCSIGCRKKLTEIKY